MPTDPPRGETQPPLPSTWEGLRLTTSELFFSLQGESTYAGLPCVFIRLSGCNLRCRYCDARYTHEEPGRDLSLADILAHAARYPGAMVEITGGEPLLQANTVPLMHLLLAEGRTVLLETNGSLDLAPVPAGVITVMDVKCPGSGMEHATRLDNLALLTPRDEIKFVLCSRADYDWALAFLAAHQLIDPASSAARRQLLFSPVPGRLAPTDLAAWILQDQLPVRLQLQLHKILWPAVERGV